MPDLSSYRFSRSPEWVRQEGDTVVVGISDYAQDAVGDVVFIDLPSPGGSAALGDAIAEVESTKTVSTILAPVTGQVIAANEALANHPEMVNEDPYGAGWMFSMQVSDPDQLAALMDEAAYLAYVEEIAP